MNRDNQSGDVAIYTANIISFLMDTQHKYYARASDMERAVLNLKDVHYHLEKLEKLLGSESPHPSAEAVSENEFINKHLGNIKAKMAALKDDSRKEFHALCLSVLGYLQHQPFRSSVEYFLQKGSINGSFFEGLQLLRERILSDKFIEAVKDATAAGAVSELGITSDVAAKIMLARDAFIKNDFDEIHHQLYSIANPGFDSYTPWKRIIEIAGNKYTPMLPSEGAAHPPADAAQPSGKEVEERAKEAADKYVADNTDNFKELSSEGVHTPQEISNWSRQDFYDGYLAGAADTDGRFAEWAVVHCSDMPKSFDEEGIYVWTYAGKEYTTPELIAIYQQHLINNKQ